MDLSGTPVERPRRLLLVDAHAYAYRSFFAIRHLNAPTGEPTNAIFGFVKAMLKLRADLQPDHEAVIWDGGLAPERMALLPGYKSQRPPMPADLEMQLDGLVDWVTAVGSHSLCRDGVEADDWLATIAVQAATEGLDVILASPDKDFMQLVQPGIRLTNPGDKTGRLWEAADVRSKTGVEPVQIVDWLSLVGDTVDNIPGVSGVGPKTATALLNEFGDCDRLLASLEWVASEGLRSRLADAVEVVRRNREMVRLRLDVPSSPAISELRYTAPDRVRLASLYERWGFRSLRAALDSAGGQRDLFESPPSVLNENASRDGK